MTMQRPDVLVIEPGVIELPALQLFGVVLGNPDNPSSWEDYPFATSPDPAKAVHRTALWRGCVSTYRLRGDGRLMLERLDYPGRNAAPDLAQELLQGAFWLDLRTWLLGDGIRLPFANGAVQRDSSLWPRTTGLSPR